MEFLSFGLKIETSGYCEYSKDWNGETDSNYAGGNELRIKSIEASALLTESEIKWEIKVNIKNQEESGLQWEQDCNWSNEFVGVSLVHHYWSVSFFV